MIPELILAVTFDCTNRVSLSKLLITDLRTPFWISIGYKINIFKVSQVTEQYFNIDYIKVESLLE